MGIEFYAVENNAFMGITMPKRNDFERHSFFDRMNTSPFETETSICGVELLLNFCYSK